VRFNIPRALQLLSSLPKLKNLGFGSLDLQETGNHWLKLGNIERVDLSSAKLSKEVLKRVLDSLPNLRKADLSNTKVDSLLYRGNTFKMDDELLISLIQSHTQLTSLKIDRNMNALNVRKSPFTMKSLIEIVNCTRITSLKCKDCWWIDDISATTGNGLRLLLGEQRQK
jgi:hypothetical protein